MQDLSSCVANVDYQDYKNIDEALKKVCYTTPDRYPEIVLFLTLAPHKVQVPGQLHQQHFTATFKDALLLVVCV